MSSPTSDATADELPPVQRKRGRPALISREMILATALDIMTHDPSINVSHTSIARELKVTPIAIYKYFASREELMRTLTEVLLENLHIDAPEAVTPVEKLRAWAYGMREHFLKHPQLINMLSWESGYTLAAWINKTGVLLDALHELGLDGIELARTTHWIWNGVLSAIHTELHDRHRPRRMDELELQTLPPRLQQAIQLIASMRTAPDHYDRFFDFQFDRMVDALPIGDKSVQRSE